MLDKLVKLVAGLMGVMLLGIGLCWLVAPSVADIGDFDRDFR